MPKDFYDLDPDPGLTANSLTRAPSQRAIKAAIDNKPVVPAMSQGYARNASGKQDGWSYVPTPAGTGLTYGNAVAVMDGGGDPTNSQDPNYLQGGYYTNRLFVKVPAGQGRPVELSGKIAFIRDNRNDVGLVVTMLITDLTDTYNPGALAATGIQGVTFQTSAISVPNIAFATFTGRISHCVVDTPDLVIDRYWGLGYALATVNVGATAGNAGAGVHNLNSPDSVVGGVGQRTDFSALLARLL